MKKYNLLSILLFVLVACPGEKKLGEETFRTETTYIVKKNEFLETTLARAFLQQNIYRSILNTLQNGGFPFRKCFPGDSISIIKNSDEFVKLTYSQDPVHIYYVINNNNNLSMAMKFPYIDTFSVFLKGEVKSTLYESILELGESPYLVFRYVDVFAWEIDFVTETRKGDSFFIYLEKTFCDSLFVDYSTLVVTRYKGNIGDFYGIYYRDVDGHEDYYNHKGESLRKALLKSPLKYSYISSYFSKRRYHPILKIWRPHHGLDYAAPIGAPVSSIGDGVVTFKGWKGGYGNLVEIRHKNKFKTRYGHLSKFEKGLYKGKKVKMGELIGYVGSTGLSTGPHLHFEMHKNGTPINPLKANIPRAPSVKKEYMSDFQQLRDSLLKYIETAFINKNEELSGN